jgi:CHAT domain-containing protein
MSEILLKRCQIITLPANQNWLSGSPINNIDDKGRGRIVDFMNSRKQLWITPRTTDRGHCVRAPSFMGVLILLMLSLIAHAEDGHRLLSDGHFAAADQAFGQCLADANAVGNARLGAECLLGQASAKIMLSQLSAAEQNLDALVLLAQQNGFVDIRLAALIAQGRLYTFQARFNQADEILAMAIDGATRQSDSASAAKAWITRSQIAAERLDKPLFLSHLQQAVQLAPSIPDPRERARILAASASIVLQNQGNEPLSNRAINLGSRAAADAQAIVADGNEQRIKSLTSGLLGEFYLAAGRPDDALEMARNAVFHAQQDDAPELAYRWEWLSGRALRAQGDLVKATQAMDRSIERLSQVRSGLLSGIRGRRTSFRDLVGPLFQDHADILLSRSSDASETGDQQQLRSRARDVIEAFKSAELQDYFLDECVVNVQQKQTLLDQLDPRTAVLYPILLKQRTEILVSVAGHIHQFTVDAGQDQIARLAVQFRRALERRSSHRYRSQAARLYDWLLRPAMEVLRDQDVDTIVFVPDGALRTIPIGALYDGEQFLIEQYALATTPGLNLTDPQPIPRVNMSFLVNGLTDAVQGYPALPSVEVELGNLQEQFSTDAITLFKNESYITSNIEQAISEQAFDIVHFASHGEFQANVSESFLLTYEGKLTMNKLEEFMQLRRFSEQPVELLTLSACQTAAGDDRAALGLAGIAIKAGARSALGTLWFINDRAASQLISDFYQNLTQPDHSKAQALRLAQLNLIKDRRYNHPGYWAPFLLIGNWL